MYVPIFRLNQKKKGEFRYRRFRFKFRCSYIYNKVWKTQIVPIASLKYWVRCSCIYTWVNVNLNLPFMVDSFSLIEESRFEFCQFHYV